MLVVKCSSMRYKILYGSITLPFGRMARFDTFLSVVVRSKDYVLNGFNEPKAKKS